MIRLFDVVKSYPARGKVLDGACLEVARGEYVAIHGPSGSGKSTLFRLIIAAESPDSGQVTVAGRNIARLRRGSIPLLRRNIGMVFQDFKLLPDRTVFENVALPLRIRGVHGGRLRERVLESVRGVGLEDKLVSRCHALSGGERQRVAVARALAPRPEILLADEPTGNLDPDAAAELLEQFCRAHREGLTVVLATHDPAIARASQADRLVELTGGRIEERELLSGVRTSAEHAKDGGLREVSFVV